MGVENWVPELTHLRFHVVENCLREKTLAKGQEKEEEEEREGERKGKNELSQLFLPVKEDHKDEKVEEEEVPEETREDEGEGGQEGFFLEEEVYGEEGKHQGRPHAVSYCAE